MTGETSTAPAGDGVLAFNPFAPGFFDDPYTEYRRARETDPVHRTPLGIWAVFRYDDVVRVLRDPTLSVEDRNAVVPEALRNPEIEARRNERGTRAILNLDPPDHHRIRRLVAKPFTPSAIESLRDRVAALVDEHLDALAGRGTGEADVIADFAFPLPFTVISEMMGIPAGRDRLELRRWSNALVRTLEPVLTVEMVDAALEAGEHMRGYLLDVVAWKRAHPADDLLSALIAAEEAGDRLTEAELVDQVVLLFIAGHETTVNLVGNGTLALLRNRSELERLRADPTLDAGAVEELLRYDSPVQMSRRIAVDDVDLDGHRIDAGSFVMTCLGSANHDPLHWGDGADTLDLGRPGADRHVSFGGGFHHCLGNQLARLEGQVAIPRLIRRFPGIELAADTLQWNGRLVLRGLERLPVTLGG